MEIEELACALSVLAKACRGAKSDSSVVLVNIGYPVNVLIPAPVCEMLGQDFPSMFGELEERLDCRVEGVIPLNVRQPETPSDTRELLDAVTESLAGIREPLQEVKRRWEEAERLAIESLERIRGIADALCLSEGNPDPLRLRELLTKLRDVTMLREVASVLEDVVGPSDAEKGRRRSIIWSSRRESPKSKRN